MLYIVATPIGNIKEITYRAVEVLSSVDVILCEDTRYSRILLSHYDIKKPLISYQKFNEREKCDSIINMLKDGKDVALISDAGMPLISDPGATIVKEAQKQGLQYTVVSGACACINAVVLSSLDTSRFCMVGFLPDKEGERKKTLELFKDLRATLVFYSPPHDIDRDLKTLYECLGARKVAVVREISKLYEQVCVGVLGEELNFMRKGEFVIVVEGAPPASEALNNLSVQEHIKRYLDLGKTEKEAIKAVASDRKVAKSLIYAESLKMKEKNDERSKENMA